MDAYGLRKSILNDTIVPSFRQTANLLL